MSGTTAGMTLHQWKGRLMAYPNRIRGGLAVASRPVRALRATAQPEEVGELIQACLETSATLKFRGMKADRRLLEELRAKSWGELERNAKCLSVTQSTNGIQFTPMIPFVDPQEREWGMTGDPLPPLPLDSSPTALGEFAIELLAGL